MEKSGGSRLLKMQARFQQKQLEEREMKIASLYEAQQARALDRVRHSPSNGMSNGTANSMPNGTANSTPPKQVPVHPGKVRQMFEERRTKAGIDKSYPLQPIHNTDRPAARKPVPNGYSKVTSRVQEKRQTTRTTTTVKKQHKMENIVNGSGDLNHNHEPDFNSVKRTHQQTNGLISSMDELDRDNNYVLENETFPDALAPAATPRSPEAREPKRPPRRNSPTKTRPQPVAPPRRASSDKSVSHSKAKGAMQCSANPIPKKAAASSDPRALKRATATSAAASPGGEGEPCSVCGRRFAPDRLAKHEEICKKAKSKKPRKPFDALKHRLAGTEAEPFIGKLKKQGNSNNNTKAKSLNSNWRQKHEEFIQAIRAAKQVQQHLNAGGKLSDLPPPPPSENPDYVQCPHCSRRFNQAAAERHIPKCASYQFNKAKPNASKKR